MRKEILVRRIEYFGCLILRPMKQLIPLFTFLLIITITSCTTKPIQLEDGMYLITRTGTSESELLPLNENERIIEFNQEFIDKTDQEPLLLVIDETEYAPFLLAEKPTTETQEDSRKRLLLTMNEKGKAQLAAFTEKHLMQMTGIVVKGEALTKHQIKAAIDGGKLQITRCTDNACEMLFIELEDNVVGSSTEE